MRKFVFILFLFVSFEAMAQNVEQPRKKLVVADIETHIPLRNAIVITTKSFRDTLLHRAVWEKEVNDDGHNTVKQST